jgi:hypothetical protein
MVYQDFVSYPVDVDVDELSDMWTDCCFSEKTL